MDARSDPLVLLVRLFTVRPGGRSDSAEGVSNPDDEDDDDEEEEDEEDEVESELVLGDANEASASTTAMRALGLLATMAEPRSACENVEMYCTITFAE